MLGKGYFRWSAEDTTAVLKDFREWIQKPFGNCLPSKIDLVSDELHNVYRKNFLY